MDEPASRTANGSVWIWDHTQTYATSLPHAGPEPSANRNKPDNRTVVLSESNARGRGPPSAVPHLLASGLGPAYNEAVSVRHAAVPGRRVPRFPRTFTRKGSIRNVDFHARRRQSPDRAGTGDATRRSWHAEWRF